MVFTRAGPAEILRAAQKDDLISKTLKSVVTDIILRLGGTRAVIHYKTAIEAVGYFLYYGNTTLNGLQTLGEEYTGIVQVDSTLRILPSFMVRLIMLLLDCFGALITLRLLSLTETKIKSNSSLHYKAKGHILEFISILKAIIPFVNHIHKALFYCIGGTYHLAKRLTGINYVLVRYWLKDRDSVYGFRILGLVTSLHLAVMGVQGAVSWVKRRRESGGSEVSTGVINGLDEAKEAAEHRGGRGKCSLCFEPPSAPSLTPCGHVFCWSCIHDWLSSQPNCPLCRESVKPSRVIPLKNY